MQSISHNTTTTTFDHLLVADPNEMAKPRFSILLVCALLLLVLAIALGDKEHDDGNKDRDDPDWLKNREEPEEPMDPKRPKEPKEAKDRKRPREPEDPKEDPKRPREPKRPKDPKKPKEA